MGFVKYFSLNIFMEEIKEAWSRLSLQRSEGDGFRLRFEIGFKDFILAAKFFTK